MRELTPVELNSFLVVRPLRFVLKLVIVLAWMAVGAVLALQEPLAARGAGIVLLGALFAHMVELQHQCLHETAFTRGSRLNRACGVVLGVPMLVSHSHYKAQHLHHHRFLGTPEDREFFAYRYDRLGSMKGLVAHLVLLPHLSNVVARLGWAVLGRPRFADEHDARALRAEYVLLCGFLVAMAILALLFDPGPVLVLWFLPLLVSLPIHALIELPEHYGRNRQVPSVYVNTQSIETSAFWRWFTNANNFHVEHHRYAGVPNDRLKELHERMLPDLVHVHPSYRSFFTGLLRSRAPVRAAARGGSDTRAS